ncbi:MAG: trypsin-like peptidase domain-containing protein [Planctomycetes bacterium]|nr:trypsin-like peptidase domain-containing protein [Planctomycetota bacterium]
MKFFVGCFCSACLGGILAVALCESRLEPAAHAAQGPAPATLGAPDPARKPAPREAGARTPPAVAATHPLAPGQLTQDEQVNIAVYEEVNRSVVNITTRGARAEGIFMLEVPTEGAGSGSVLDKQGHILTNNHVIDGARQVMVTLFDGKSYEARYVGADPINDVAVIKIDAPADALHPVVFGDSRQLKVGMRVFAIGNPFGLERTLTTGIISSLNRTLQIHENRTVKSIIQIDAAIKPGNSGGPLLDSHSKLIGMNTAIASRTGQSAGVGFAIPIGLIARIVPQLIEKGRVVRPEVGISKVFETEQGLLVLRVVPGGPAERAGLQGPQLVRRQRGPFVVESVDRSAADLIIAVDGAKVTTADDFLSIIEAKEPGQHITLTVVRKGKEQKVTIALGGE